MAPGPKVIWTTIAVPVAGLLVALAVRAYLPLFGAGRSLPLPDQTIAAAAWGCGALAGLSAAAALAPLALFALQGAVAAYAGARRGRLARVFPWLCRLTVICLPVLLLTQAMVALAATALIEFVLLDGLIFWITLAPLLSMGGAGLFAVSKACGRAGASPSIHEFGSRLLPANAPDLFDRVRGIADRLGVDTVDEIVLGLQPNFYIATCPIDLPGDPGRSGVTTLYLSVTLATLFTSDELDAVIGHELGHLRGGDLDYTRRFAPVYATLGGALGTLVQPRGVLIAAIPAVLILSHLYGLFEEGVATASRQREFEADRASVEAASAAAAAGALVKSAIYAAAWASALDDLAFRQQARDAGDLASAFAESMRASLYAWSLDAALEWALLQATIHPLDRHPSTAARLVRLGVDVRQLGLAALRPASAEERGVPDWLAAGSRALTAKALGALDEAAGLVSHPVLSAMQEAR